MTDRARTTSSTTTLDIPDAQDQEHDMNVQTSPSIDSAADDARRAKVEELQRRRAARVEPAPAAPVPGVPRSRRGAAQGSKIAAAGFGMATMFGLVAAMGFAGRTSASTPPAPVPTAAPAQVVVVIHPADGTAATAAVPGTPGVVAATPSQPIVLSAQPRVVQAPAPQATSAPAGQSNGSR
jgi:hypothetical protein